MAAPIIFTNPHMEIYSPKRRLTKADLERLAQTGGVVMIHGLKQDPDGTFGGARIFFDNEDAMNAYAKIFA